MFSASGTTWASPGLTRKQSLPRDRTASYSSYVIWIGSKHSALPHSQIHSALGARASKASLSSLTRSLTSRKSDSLRAVRTARSVSSLTAASLFSNSAGNYSPTPSTVVWSSVYGRSVLGKIDAAAEVGPALCGVAGSSGSRRQPGCGSLCRTLGHRSGFLLRPVRHHAED